MSYPVMRTRQLGMLYWCNEHGQPLNMEGPYILSTYTIVCTDLHSCLHPLVRKTTSLDPERDVLCNVCLGVRDVHILP